MLVGLYSGAFIDIVYDHFLANDVTFFKNDHLEIFSQATYTSLQENKHLLPEKFAIMLPYMVQHNWLLNYKNLWGIERSFEGLTRRAKFINDSTGAYHAFTNHYAALQNCYNSFFPDLNRFAIDYVNKL